MMQVGALYWSELGVNPSLPNMDGWNYWVDQVMNHGKTIVDVKANFDWCRALPHTDPNYCPNSIM